MNKNVSAEESTQAEQSQESLDPVQQSSQQLFEIRDLLFGDQLRSVHQRADEMEARFQNQIQELNNNFSQALAEAKHQFHEQLANQQRDLQQTHQELSGADAQLRSDMLEQLAQLSQQVQQNYIDVMAKINAASAELSNNKADRKTLAAMLASMADNLTKQE